MLPTFIVHLVLPLFILWLAVKTLINANQVNHQLSPTNALSHDVEISLGNESNASDEVSPGSLVLATRDATGAGLKKTQIGDLINSPHRRNQLTPSASPVPVARQQLEPPTSTPQIVEGQLAKYSFRSGANPPKVHYITDASLLEGYLSKLEGHAIQRTHASIQKLTNLYSCRA